MKASSKPCSVDEVEKHVNAIFTKLGMPAGPLRIVAVLALENWRLDRLNRGGRARLGLHLDPPESSRPELGQLPAEAPPFARANLSGQHPVLKRRLGLTLASEHGTSTLTRKRCRGKAREPRPQPRPAVATPLPPWSEAERKDSQRRLVPGLPPYVRTERRM